MLIPVTSRHAGGLRTPLQQREQAIRELAVQLRQRYCIAAGGEKAAAFLEHRLRDGAYDTLGDAAAFALAVTVDLQGATGDTHLRLDVAPPAAAGEYGPFRVWVEGG